jgi:hypothetical protein
MVAQPVNVLYLGMADDIMAPLLLVPDLDTLYVLNVLDKSYGSWEDHKIRIRAILEQGGDRNLVEEFYLDKNARKSMPRGRKWKNVHTLAGPSTILSDEDTEVSECMRGSNSQNKYKYCYTMSVWRLDFMYNGKIRHLVYYYNYDFVQYVWPEEIQNIQHYIWNGAYSWGRMIEYPTKENFRQMTMERSAPEAYVYALSFNHRKFPEHMLVYNGHERYGLSVAKMKLNFSDPNWWKRNYKGGKQQTRTRKNKRTSIKRKNTRR